MEGEKAETCEHPKIPLPEFDERAAAGMSAYEVRDRWPRTMKECPDCGATVIVYASFMHYIAGDW